MTVRENIDNDVYTTKFEYPNKRQFDDLNKLRAARQAYQDDVAKLETQFRNDIEAEYYMETFSQAVRDKIYAMAWDCGHASGYSEVLNEYDYLYDLVVMLKG
jgi:hypothetical protein